MKHLFLAVIMLLSFNSYSQIANKAEVIEVVSGDTYKVKVDTFVYWVKLTGAVCPVISNAGIYYNQEFGVEVKDQVSKFLKGKDVVITEYGIDEYRKPLVTVIVENLDMAKVIIENGLGMLDDSPAYSKATKAYYNSQMKKAKELKLGIWINQNAEHPSKFIKSHKLK